MTIHKAVNKFIQSADSDLAVVCKDGQWELVNKDQFPTYAHYDYLDADIIFSVLNEVLDQDSILQLATKLSA